MDVSPLLILLALAALAMGIGVVLARRPASQALTALRKTDRSALPAADESSETHPSGAEPPADPAPANATADADIFAIASALDDLYRQSAYPTDLLENERFRRGVTLLSRPEIPSRRLVDYMVGANVVVACMALEALAHREDDTRFESPLLKGLPQVHLWTAAFALRVLARRSSGAVIGRVLATLAPHDWTGPLQTNILRDFITERLARGEVPQLDPARLSVGRENLAPYAALLHSVSDALPEELRSQAAPDGDGAPLDLALLEGIGRVWEPIAADSVEWTIDERLADPVAQIELLLRSDPPRSVALVGEPGVGKTTIIRAVAARLQATGWTIFQCSAADLMAGQSFIGQLEQRIQDLARTLSGRPALWVLPALHEMLYAGRHMQSPVGALEMLLPHIERGELRIVAEVEPVAYEKLLQAKPRLRASFAAARVEPASDEQTLAVAARWAERHGAEGREVITREAVHECLQLARQYVADQQPPGNLLSLLELAWRRQSAASGSPPTTLGADDVLVTLSQLSGLPLDILDERVALDLDDLRALFDGRVIGQPEAVECLVERIAMIKAGVCDPTRPLGVFLFVGPTGTGKTEIAKTLAQYLFGSPDRMIRLDMSEFQAPDSIERLLGGGANGTEGASLVSAIRRQPFSVVLLDEFEKASANIWDLFLQVFDDGRLTDRGGNVADFRHAIIIVTSNLGATLPYGASVGFTRDQPGFAVAQVERAVQESFRREFINRIDRVIVFRPLGRSEMREILRKELRDVLSRRAFRNRSWAVEWEDSAVELLLKKGFTADLGARPLKRAVERYVLAPLALALVNHQAPEGDQFLFVRSDGERIDVVFVDPDAPEEPAALPADRPAGMTIPSLVLSPSGTPGEVEFLREQLAAFNRRFEAGGWEERKAEVLEEMRDAGFWTTDARHARLGLAELLDRMEAALDTGWSLLQRLSGGRQRRPHYPEEIVGRLAQQVYLLDSALASLEEEEPQDAFIMVRALVDDGEAPSASDEFAARIAGMYVEWARKRRMRIEVLKEQPGGGKERFGLVAAISGFAAYRLLRAESGLHVFETPDLTGGFERSRVRVIVSPQSALPVQGTVALARQAVKSLEEARGAGQSTIVRRYRSEPSPLVRDGVRGWRTGRLDLVFGGEFDVLT